MVSNEIYWGTLHSSAAPGGKRNYCSQQSAPPTPPRQTPERNCERNRLVTVMHQYLDRGTFQYSVSFRKVCDSVRAV